MVLTHIPSIAELLGKVNGILPQLATRNNEFYAKDDKTVEFYKTTSQYKVTETTSGWAGRRGKK
jgi:hypothetical protein